MAATRSRAATAQKIDELMERASRALAETRYFECERLALEALDLAHASHDYDRMARLLLPLQEARRQKRLAAIDTGKLYRISELPSATRKLKPGCYLIEPPLVGADGRDLRDRANQQEVPVFIVVREPKTRLGDWPIVMIGPVTVRTKVEPPEKEEAPDIAWMIEAAEALGEEALSTVDPQADIFEQVEQLLDRLGTVTEHEKLHQALEAACREAAAEVARSGLPTDRHAPKDDDELDLESDDDM